MRLRRNWQGEAALRDLPGVLPADPAEINGRIGELFGRKAPLHLELGMGKGDFLIAKAGSCPKTNFIGVEKNLTVQYIAAKKNLAAPLPNLRFLPLDAEELELYFQPGEIECIYLNFSDPWPKKRHARRRLTHVDMLKIYRKVLAPAGQVQFKTDSLPLFEFSLEQFLLAGMSLGQITRDLHHSGFEGNIMTEYERRFAKLGQPICRCEVWNG